MILSKNKLLKLAVGLSIAVMMLTSCAPAIVASVTPVSDEKPNLASTTEASPTVIPTETKVSTATPTSTPEATATPEIEINICTAENFLSPENEINSESLYSTLFLEALRKIPVFFDLEKMKDVPLVNYKTTGTGPEAGTSYISYSKDIPISTHTPNFPSEETQPFRRFLIGFTTFLNQIYAVVPTAYYNPDNPDQPVWVITLFRFDEYDDTDAGKIASMKIWENDMNVTPIISTNYIPRTKIPDPLVARTFAEPDIQERIDEFVNHNTFKSGGDLTTLDGKVFLTKITRNSSHWYE